MSEDVTILDPLWVLTYWDTVQADWKRILDSGDADSRKATIDAMLEFLREYGVHVEQMSGKAKVWSDVALYEMLRMLPRDELIAVLNELVKQANYDGGNELVRWFLTNPASAGRWFVIDLLPGTADDK